MSTKNLTATSYVIIIYNESKHQLSNISEEFVVVAGGGFLFQEKTFFIKFAINTVYTLPRTYNITLSTTFITFLFFFVQTC